MKKLLLNKKLIAIGIVIVIIAIFVLLFKDNIMKMIYPKKYEEYVSIYADKYQVEENLIFLCIHRLHQENFVLVAGKKGTKQA